MLFCKNIYILNYNLFQVLSHLNINETFFQKKCNET